MAENGRMGKGKFRIISLYFNIFVIVWEKTYVTIMTTLGHVLIAYTPVGLYAGSLSRPRLMPETSVIPAYSKFGDRNFAPSGQRRRRDLAEHRSARTRLSLRLIFPQVTRCFCFAPQKKSNETRLYASPYGKGRWCAAPEGIRKSAFKRATRKTGETIPPSTSPLCTRGATWSVFPLFTRG